MQTHSNHWQLQEAKAKFSHVVNCAADAPQFISKHGRESAVLISIEDYQKMSKQDNIADFFMNSPVKGLSLDLERDKSLSRELSFE
ncbi:MAG: type II toxin-antitoxin system Phd/YefM family antitoxin [Urechidicola sp.]|nr:type II toxin-antitoxin system Phd/YefM family antitoxin [Urechidicola sp.]